MYGKSHSRFRQEQLSPLTYLTYPEWLSGFTVTDSPGFSPDSAPCPQQAEEKELYVINYVYYTAKTKFCHPKKEENSPLSAIKISPVVAATGVQQPAAGFMNTMKTHRLFRSMLGWINNSRLDTNHRLCFFGRLNKRPIPRF